MQPKIYILIFLVLSVTASHPQLTYNNFSFRDDMLLWEKQFTANKRIDSLYEMLLLLGLVKEVKQYKNTIYGDLRDFNFQYRDYKNSKHYRYGGFHLGAKCSGYLTITQKDSVYNVSIKRITFLRNSDSIMPYPTTYALEIVATEKGDRKELTNYFMECASYIMNAEFEKMLTPYFRE